MKAEDDILKKMESLKRNQGFSTPEGYFDSFADKVMSNIEKKTIPVEKPKLITLIKPQLGLVASFAALFLIAYTAISILLPHKKTNQELLSKHEILAAIEEDLYSIDETQLFELVYPEHNEITIDNIALTKSEIIEYLIDEGSDEELFNTDF